MGEQKALASPSQGPFLHIAQIGNARSCQMASAVPSRLFLSSALLLIGLVSKHKFIDIRIVLFRYARLVILLPVLPQEIVIGHRRLL